MMPQRDERPGRDYAPGLPAPARPEALGAPAILALQRTAGNAAVTRLVQRWPVGGAPPQTDYKSAGHQQGGGGAQPDIGAMDLARFDSVYNQLTGAWPFMAQQQVLAIDSVYTEARRPDKPDLVEDILVALATAGLGAVISMLGNKLQRAIEGRLLKAVADPSTVTNEALKSAYGHVQQNVRMLATAANDAFEDGVESLTGPRVQDLVRSGKKPIDAFFEGQKSAAVAAGKQAFDAAERKRPTILALESFWPGLAVLGAQALLDIVNETFATAQQVQKEQTIAAWLRYQAQAQLGAVEYTSVSEGVHGERTTNLTTLGNVAGLSATPGVLYVDAEQEDARTVRATKAALPGLTKPMLTSIETQAIRGLRLPMRYLVWSHHAPRFVVVVNEMGEARLAAGFGESLEALGGAEEVHKQLGGYTLKELHAKADKD